MLIQKLETDEWNNIIFETSMDNDQLRTAEDRAPRPMKHNDPTGTVMYTDMDYTGYGTISRQFAAIRLKKSAH